MNSKQSEECVARLLSLAIKAGWCCRTVYVLVVMCFTSIVYGWLIHHSFSTHCLSQQLFLNIPFMWALLFRFNFHLHNKIVYKHLNSEDKVNKTEHIGMWKGDSNFV